MDAPASDARSRFAAWVASVGRKEAASILECHWTYPGLVIRGERVPQRRLAHAIERATASWTGGQIRTEAWDALEDDAAESAANDSAPEQQADKGAAA